MLKINPDPQFQADVEITVPGQEETGTISLTLKYRTREAVVEFWERAAGKKEAGIKGKKKEAVASNKKETAAFNKKEADTFLDFVEGWEGLDAEFTRENVDIFLRNYPMASREIVMEYNRLLLESRVKN